MAVVVERVSLLLRLRRDTVERLDGIAAVEVKSRSQVIRELMAVGLAQRDMPARRAAPAVQGGMSREDREELRQWRAFADRTWVNGDPERQVTPGIDMHGWTFLVSPVRDENMEIA